MFDIKNYLTLILIKIGLTKPKKIGIKLENGSKITIRNSKISGFDTAIDAKNISDFRSENNSLDG